MKFGLHFGSRGVAGEPDSLKAIAQKAEALGYEHFGMSDHVIVATEVDRAYPYSASGKFFAQDTGVSLEQVTALSFVAAVTSKIRLLTSVLVLPHRHPVLAAKMLATVDVLSKGRLTAGVGVGWMREEFEALNITDFDARGRVTDEYIQVMKELWTKGRASFHGEFIDFTDAAADPKPVQQPHPPIWIGGESMPAIRRTAALGDTWYPFGSNPKFRMDTSETFVARRDKLFAEAERLDRDPTSIGLAYNCAFHNEEAQTHIDGGRLLFTGSPEERAEDIAQLEAAGVSTMIVNVTSNDVTHMLERVERFSSDVMALLD
mgnify:CR=1 FL=1